MIVRRLDENFDMSFGHGLANYARESEACAQNVRTRLQLLKEEWFLDTDAGVPYLQEIAAKPANLPLAEAEIKRTILQTEDVAEITEFQMRYDRDVRKLTIEATVSTVYGTTVNIKVTK